MNRQWLLVTVTAGLVAGIAGVAIRAATSSFSHAAEAAPLPETPAPTATPRSLKPTGRQLWRVRWTTPVENVRAASLSEGANCIVWVNGQGVVRRLETKTGQVRWQTKPLPGVRAVLATTSGSVLAWSPRNRQRPTLHILNASGGEVGAQRIPTAGAIWSVVASEKQDQVFVGTGNREIRQVTWTNPQWKTTTTWRTDGIPEDIALAANAPQMLVQTWLPAGLSSWAWEGVPYWGVPNIKPERRQVALSADGRVAAQVVQARCEASSFMIQQTETATRRILWQERVDGTEPRLCLTRGGSHLAVSYLLKGERKVALFDSRGQRRYGDKGGHYLAPELVTLSGDGKRMTVYDVVRHSLFTFDERGRTVSALTLPDAPVLQTHATRDGRFVLQVREDSLTLLEASL